jgi:transposase
MASSWLPVRVIRRFRSCGRHLQDGLDDGRIEIDSNVVERSIRPIALGRKNHLFAGSDGGGEQWAVIASLVETCKMNAVDPQAYLHDVLSKIVARHPMGRIDELLPFAYVPAAEKAAA